MTSLECPFFASPLDDNTSPPPPPPPQLEKSIDRDRSFNHHVHSEISRSPSPPCDKSDTSTCPFSGTSSSTTLSTPGSPSLKSYHSHICPESHNTLSSNTHHHRSLTTPDDPVQNLVGGKDIHVDHTELNNIEADEEKSNSTKLQRSASDFQAHHHLPPCDPLLPGQAILYLPPLLSPLPHNVSHGHAEGERPEALAEFTTRLPDIDPASLALHEALHGFRPKEEYASLSYDEAFNWHELSLPLQISREWYCVVFRSVRNPASSSLSLYAADRAAHQEAVQNGGLVMYWYGAPSSTGENLATCIWQSRRHAVRAIAGPRHMEAMKHAKGAYERYELERWVLSKSEGEKGVRLGKWEGGDVGW